jgi:hypothetical protein
MTILTTAVAISGDPAFDGKILKMDTIEHEGRMWLVTSWLVPRTGGLSKPERLICLDTLPHQKASMNGLDFVLNNPLPKAVTEGRVPSGLEALYVVIERPDIEVRHPRGFH